jgi:hypothetical protein
MCTAFLGLARVAGSKYEWQDVRIGKATAVVQIRELVARNAADVYLNLCDGAWDEDRAGIEVVQALER